jgi:microcystin-dependent protein
MSEPYLGEIRCFSFGFAPKGWSLCNGQTLQISQNQALFSILGTTYGGNGVQTFALPNLQGQVPAHVGPGFVLGQAVGQVNHTLTIPEMPAHSHAITSDIVEPGGATEHTATPSVSAAIGPSNPDGLYNTSVGGNPVTLASSVLSSVGGSQPHPNMQPYLVLNFCIAMQGIFPSRN